MPSQGTAIRHIPAEIPLEQAGTGAVPLAVALVSINAVTSGDTPTSNPPEATAGDLPTPRANDVAAVPLWNPHVAALLSLVFTPVFGAWLHCSNAVALGDARLRRVAWMWLGVALAFTASGLYLVSAGQLAATSAFSASALLSGYTVVWYAFAGHKQSRVIARLGRPQWRPRSFWKPLLVASLFMALPALIVALQRHL